MTVITASIIDELLTNFGYLAVFLAVGIESLGTPVPGETFSSLPTRQAYSGSGCRYQDATCRELLCRRGECAVRGTRALPN